MDLHHLNLPPGLFERFCDTPRVSSGRKKKKKNPFGNWFGICTMDQLKEICGAAKIPTSGTNEELGQRLMACEATCELGLAYQTDLKRMLEEKGLSQTGKNKLALVLRLLHHKFGTGEVKRAVTETSFVDPTTGETVQAPKKKRQKRISKPKESYTLVAKKMKAVKTKKYQTQYGPIKHAPDVYRLMTELVVYHCIVIDNVVESDPALAEEIAQAVLQAFYDNWHVMERPWVGSHSFRCVVDAYADILKVAGPQLSPAHIEIVVDLLESINASVSGYCLAERTNTDSGVHYSKGGIVTDYVRKNQGDNVFEDAIRVIMPNYNKTDRPPKVGKLLRPDVQRLSDSLMNAAVMN